MSVQLIPGNWRKGRRFTPKQKLQILKEWEISGNGMNVAKRHQIHPHTLYRWRKALKQGAETFLSGRRSKTDPRIRELEEENRNLKEALAMQAQELMLLKGSSWKFVQDRGGESLKSMSGTRYLWRIEELHKRRAAHAHGKYDTKDAQNQGPSGYQG